MACKQHRNALAAGHTLHWYRIENVLGHGGFALTYLARDVNLDRLVAIKEYMPTQLCVREPDGSVHPTSKEAEEDYSWGLDRFISEARTLTRFEHPSLVRVYNVFEANNTAYMIMNYEQGRGLREILRTGRRLTDTEVLDLLLPLLDGLEVVHRQGFVHRDIKPGNIFIRDSGGPVLLDFGSARQTRGSFSTRTLTNLVSPGYAPIEQYAGKSDRQGPWTDIYGLAATAYEAITGRMPEAAIDRSLMINDASGDSLVKTTVLCRGRYPDGLLAAIDHGLAFHSQDRPQSVAAWRRELTGDDYIPAALNLADPAPATFTLPEPGAQAEGNAATVVLTGREAGPPVVMDEPETERREAIPVPVEPEPKTLTPEALKSPPASRHRPVLTIMALSGLLLLGFIAYHMNVELFSAGRSSGPAVSLQPASMPVTAQQTTVSAVDEVVANEVPVPAYNESVIPDPSGPWQETEAAIPVMNPVPTGAEDAGEITDIPAVTASRVPTIDQSPAAPETVVEEPESPVETVTEVTVQEQVAAPESERSTPEAVSLSQTAPEPVRNPDPEPVQTGEERRQRRIAELLAAARQDVDALRLTTPEGNNAYDKYLQVLAIDQDNLTAVRGIDGITDTYLELVYTDIREGRLEQAALYLDRADYLRPGQPKIVAAREALDSAVRDAERSKTVFGKFRRLLDF